MYDVGRVRHQNPLTGAIEYIYHVQSGIEGGRREQLRREATWNRNEPENGEIHHCCFTHRSRVVHKSRSMGVAKLTQTTRRISVFTKNQKTQHKSRLLARSCPANFPGRVLTCTPRCERKSGPTGVSRYFSMQQIRF